MKKLKCLLPILIICLTFVLSGCDRFLAVPENVAIKDDVLSWTAVENADYYIIKINDDYKKTSNTSFSLAMLAEGDYTLTVKACDSTGKFKNSAWSEAISYTKENKIVDNPPEENPKSILIIENFPDESVELCALLGDDFDTTVATVGADNFPATLDELKQYDEIILNNIASADLTVEFQYVLEEYVSVAGGGLLTVGGSEPDDINDAHAYDVADMRDSLLQAMLPVKAEYGRLPVGVVIVIDNSGSMTVPSQAVPEKTKLDLAKDAAKNLLIDWEILGVNDYFGVLNIENKYDVATPIRPMTQLADIIRDIDEIDEGGGTWFAPALTRASMDLRPYYLDGSVEEMHVVVITDGSAMDFEDYKKVMQLYRPEEGPQITYSFIAIEPDDDSMAQLEEACMYGGGRFRIVYGDNLTWALKLDISEFIPFFTVKSGEFKLVLDKDSAYATVISQELPDLCGFYYTEARQRASVILSSEDVPVYAEWEYGNGRVGSFTCDLKRTDWSNDFMTSDFGKAFLSAVIKNLLLSNIIGNI